MGYREELADVRKGDYFDQEEPLLTNVLESAVEAQEAGRPVYFTPKYKEDIPAAEVQKFRFTEPVRAENLPYRVPPKPTDADIAHGKALSRVFDDIEKEVIQEQGGIDYTKKGQKIIGMNDADVAERASRQKGKIKRLQDLAYWGIQEQRRQTEEQRKHERNLEEKRLETEEKRVTKSEEVKITDLKNLLSMIPEDTSKLDPNQIAVIQDAAKRLGYMFEEGVVKPGDPNAWFFGKEKRGYVLKPTQVSAPPASALKEGVITTFKNGQRWTLSGGKPKRIQ